jgi:hypothetical protein
MTSAPEPKHPLVAELEEASRDLLYMSESDYPLTPFLWEKEKTGEEGVTPESVAALAGYPAETPVEVVDFEGFFEAAQAEEDWYEPEERLQAKGFQNLVALLQTHLADLQVYKVGGEPEREVFIVGVTETGDYAGVSTRVVET